MMPVLDSRDVLEARLSSAERALAELDGRVRALELGLPRRTSEQTASHPSAAIADAAGTDVVGTLTLIGRTFVVIAGAYLLRALTEFGALRLEIGASLAWAYAAAWTVIAYRVAPRRPSSATFFGAATVLIGMPLVWEATTRHALVGPGAGAFALSATAGLVLLTAWRRNLHALAWIATVAACIFGSLLLVMTGNVVAFTTFFIVLGIATLWLGYDREWIFLRWMTASLANLAVVALAVRAVAVPPRDSPSRVMAVQLLLLAAYLGSIGIRTLVRGRDVVPFEILQTAAALVVALGGALLVAHLSGIGLVALGSALLVLAAACYGVEFIDRRQTRGANRYFYTSLSLVFALTGGAVVADGAALSLLWLTLGILAGAVAHRSGRATLAGHSVVYLAAAAVSSGLVRTAFMGLFASAGAPWPRPGAAEWAVLAGLGVCWLQLARRDDRLIGRGPQVMRLALAPALVLGVAGFSLVVLRWLLMREGIVSVDAGMVATLRTGVLALAALAVAWLGRRVDTWEFGVLLYPLLGCGAVKLLVEDFRTSPPLLLVVAFVLYGGALIVAPRIGKAPPASSS